MIIDCHTHLNRYSRADPPTLAERYAKLKSEMDAHGVHAALVLTSYDVTPERPPTREVLEMVKGDARIGVVAGVRYHDWGPAQLAELREMLEMRLLRALKLYPGYEPLELASPVMRPLYELAGEFGVPVMIHTGDTFEPRAKVRYAHPLHVDDVAVDFREVRFVICHMGNPWTADAMEVMYKNENVFGDISGLTVGEFKPRYERLALEKINEILAYVNQPDKLMFGTDWPISDIGSYLAFARKLEATEEEMEGLLWRNAAAVFGLETGDAADAG